VDATRKYFIMDHSRCILCRRCIRACDSIAANHTLGVGMRGTRSMICADDGVPFGESSCISCGTCLQVCPTGALFDRRSAYCGHDPEVTRTPAVCLGCAVGCGIEAVTRDNQLLRVEGDWQAGNGGLLCDLGRFEIVEPRPPRILQPLVRRDWRLVEANWEEALAHVAAKLRQSERVAGLASPRLPNESLAAFATFFQEVLMSNDVALLYGDDPPNNLGDTATLREIAAADCIVVMGGDPLRQQKVIGYLIKRAFDAGAKIIVVNDKPTDLDAYASIRSRWNRRLSGCGTRTICGSAAWRSSSRRLRRRSGQWCCTAAG
jgi:formate dehydrogenase major subunit